MKKRDNPIDSSKLRKGAFTKWCKKRGYKSVTAKCIQEGLASKNPHVRKMANFARNARKWKKGGRKK